MVETLQERIAKAIGYDQPIDGLLGSGLSKMIAHQRAADICKAIGLAPGLDVEFVRAWGHGEALTIATPQTNADQRQGGEGT
jgi:hypothetical protein